MFDVHKVENDPSKVLVEIDIRILMTLMASWGVGSEVQIKTMLIDWGVDRRLAKDTYDYTFDHCYSDVKSKIRRAFYDYVYSTTNKD